VNALNQVGRWLGALAVIGAMSIDAVEQEGTAMQAARVDWNAAAEHAEWSSYNWRQDRTLAALSGLSAPEPSPDEVETLDVSVDATACLRELLGAVRGAAAELEGTNYVVATELYTALARFSKRTGVTP
jgi:hypothetical protein